MDSNNRRSTSRRAHHSALYRHPSEVQGMQGVQNIPYSGQVWHRFDYRHPDYFIQHYHFYNPSPVFQVHQYYAVPGGWIQRPDTFQEFSNNEVPNFIQYHHPLQEVISALLLPQIDHRRNADLRNNNARVRDIDSTSRAENDAILYKYEKIRKTVEEESEETCSICLCEFEENEDIRRLPCLHVFHDLCIGVWFRNNNTCPMCRTQFSL